MISKIYIYRTNDASIKKNVKVELLTCMHAQNLDPQIQKTEEKLTKYKTIIMDIIESKKPQTITTTRHIVINHETL